MHFRNFVRNTSTSLVRQAIGCGAIFGPFFAAEGRKNKEIFSYGVFGVIIICCGLSVAVLPEDERNCSL